MTVSEFIEILLGLVDPDRSEAVDFGIDQSYVYCPPSSDVIVTFASGERFRLNVTREV